MKGQKIRRPTEELALARVSREERRGQRRALNQARRLLQTGSDPDVLRKALELLVREPCQ